MAVCTFLPLMLVGFPKTFCPLSMLPISCLQKDLRLSSVDHDERQRATEYQYRGYIFICTQQCHKHMLLRGPPRIPLCCMLKMNHRLIRCCLKLHSSSCLMPNGSPHCCRQKGLEQWPFTVKQDFCFSLSAHFYFSFMRKKKMPRSLNISLFQKRKKAFYRKTTTVYHTYPKTGFFFFSHSFLITS